MISEEMRLKVETCCHRGQPYAGVKQDLIAAIEKLEAKVIQYESSGMYFGMPEDAALGADLLKYINAVKLHGPDSATGFEHGGCVINVYFPGA